MCPPCPSTRLHRRRECSSASPAAGVPVGLGTGLWHQHLSHSSAESAQGTGVSLQRISWKGSDRRCSPTPRALSHRTPAHLVHTEDTAMRISLLSAPGLQQAPCSALPLGWLKDLFGPSSHSCRCCCPLQGPWSPYFASLF